MVVLVQRLLETAVRVDRLLASPVMASLLQVSDSTFDEEGRTTIREGWLKVRFWLKGNREDVRINRATVTCDNECVNCMCIIKRVNFRSKKWSWVALKHSSVAIYTSTRDLTPRKTMLFDSKFQINRGIEATGSNTTLLVSNATYVMQLEARTKQVIHKWANAIRQASEASLWSQSHRDGSFAIPRSPMEVPAYAQWYVDGQDAYAAIYTAIRGAKKEIFIAGWWICPTIHLLRPAALHPDSRLDTLLLAKAQEGVQIYILMYKEIAMALTLNSMFSKQKFRALHENVHVLRDPDFIVKQLGMYSHHEKIVSVDQSVSFVGGLDLCFGRWDTADHVLFDADGVPTNFVGKDFSNPRVKDFIEVDQPEVDMIDRKVVPRMPWHDCHCRLEGQPARDVARHFIQRWNYSVSTRKKSKRLRHLVPRKDFDRLGQGGTRPLRKRFQNAVRAVRAMQNIRQMTQSQQTLNRGFNRYDRLARLLHLGNSSPSATGENSADTSGESSPDDATETGSAIGPIPENGSSDKGFMCHIQVVRSLSQWSGGISTERSIQNAYIRLIGSAQHFVYIENQFFVSGLEGDPYCSNRIANALVERIRRAADNHEKFRVMVVMPLLPAFPGRPDDKDAGSLRGVMHWQYRSISRGRHSIYHALVKELDDDPFKYIAFYGLRNHTVTPSGSDNGSDNGSDAPMAQKEEVYIHSKIMIVDDRSCIIGSANINERSMCGDRDSEIAVVVDDHEMHESATLGNGTFAVGKFAHSFRMRLFEEHFGVAPGSSMYDQYADPVKNDAWFGMQEHAMRNHLAYEAAFGCIPSDNVTKFSQLDAHFAQAAATTTTTIVDGGGATGVGGGGAGPVGVISAGAGAGQEPAGEPAADEEPDSEQRPASSRRKSVFSHALGEVTTSRVAAAELRDVQGHIVYFPLNFLSDEQLAPAMLPAELFQ
jgi:phospholipase D1/2